MDVLSGVKRVCSGLLAEQTGRTVYLWRGTQGEGPRGNTTGVASEVVNKVKLPVTGRGLTYVC